MSSASKLNTPTKKVPTKPASVPKAPLLHRVQERVHLFKTRLCQRLNLADPVINHGSEFMPLVCIFLGR